MTVALPVNIDNLLRRRTIESERVEYKAGWNPQSVLRTLGAFANDFHNLGGGYVVLGVEELNGRPVLPPKGLDPDSIERMQKELLNLGNSAIQPPYHPLTAIHEIDGRTIIVLYAPGGETRPYRTRVSLSAGSREWAYYIRKHSSTVRARGEDERELLGLAATVPFDDRFHRNASPDDLSFRLIQQHLQDVGSDLLQEVATLSMDVLGRRMNIVGGPSEALFPKNVGLLFFNDRPHEFFPATQIDVVWFPDGPGGDYFEEKEFRGPPGGDPARCGELHRAQLPEGGRGQATPQAGSRAFLELPDSGDRGGAWQRHLPSLLRGARTGGSADHTGGNAGLKLSRRGPLDPDGGICSAVRAVSRRYRNRRIGEFLKELDLAEGRSTGVPKILRAMHNNGSPAPRFETDDDRTWFRRPVASARVVSA